jgi:capsular exopolysaccharide synthesis family protein
VSDVLHFAPDRLPSGSRPFGLDSKGEARPAAVESARLARELVMARAPFSAAAESIRTIRTALIGAAFSRGVRAFACVSPRAGQGASLLAANLAFAFAQMEVKTLLVDANLRHRGLSRKHEKALGDLFGLPERRDGLGEALARRADDEPPLAREVAPNLAVLPAGALQPNPQELIASAGFARLAARWAEQFELVIYDAPPAMDYGDACLIAARAGSALIAARRDHARFAEVRQVSAALRSHGANISGVVANCFG